MCRLSSTDGGLDLLEEFEEKETEVKEEDKPF